MGGEYVGGERLGGGELVLDNQRSLDMKIW